MPKLLTEFVGTFFLVLVIVLSVASGSPMAPLAIGAILMVLVYMGGHISGAHYNPAVTLAVFVRGKIGFQDVMAYWLSQFAGAIAASLVGLALVHVAFAGTESHFALSPGVIPGPDRSDLSIWLTAGAVETLFTFALALVVLNVATARQTEGNSYFGVAIGFTVCAGVFAGSHISGGAFNPAVGTGPALVAALFTKNGGHSLQNIPLHVIAPCLGGVIAAWVFKLQHPDEPTPSWSQKLT